METMWTPWRIGFIVGEKPQGCLFCLKQQASGDKDAENYILHRGASCLVMLNLYPYTNGHLLIAPYQHVPSIELLDRDSLSEVCRLAQASVVALRKTLSPDGFNIGMNLGKSAGAGVADHIHLHVVPRWAGDTNFMSVLADVRLIPEALGQTYKALTRAFPEALAAQGGR